MAEELRQQVPVMKDVLTAMGVRVIEQAGLEADDLIGTIARRCEAAGMEVSVISGDRDLLQLATEHTQIRIPKTKRGGTQIEDYYAADVKEKYGVTPLEFIDMKGPHGRRIRQYPGCAGHRREDGGQDHRRVPLHRRGPRPRGGDPAARASKAITEHWDLAVMSKELATIRVDADIDYEVSGAKLGNLFTEEAYTLFQRLEFKNCLADLRCRPRGAGWRTRSARWRTKTGPLRSSRGQPHLTGWGPPILRDTKEVLPLFAKQAGVSGAALCFGEEEIFCIRAGAGLKPEEILCHLEELSGKTGCFSMFSLKEKMDFVTPQAPKRCFDGSSPRTFSIL